MDTAGRVDPNAYVAMAGKMSAAEGIAYRYGNTGTTPANTPTWHKRGDTKLQTAEGGWWQVGGPDAGAGNWGDYFSNFANALHVADDPNNRVGVSDFLAIAQSYNTFTQLPQPAPVWTRQAALGATDWIGLDDYNGSTVNARRPVAGARCYGRPGWCLESVVAYQNGLLSTAQGSNTALNRSSTQLGANKVPTGIAVTNSNEFALVTVWDTVALKGQIAVVALAGLANGASPSNPDIGDQGWGDWGAVHPGLANLGNTGYMKVLGYVDLPDTMRAPTEITATTGWNPWNGMGQNRPTAYKTPLNTESNRQQFMAGGAYANAYAKGGMAIVVSKSEKRAAFIDLKPLFDYFNGKYFGARGDFDSTKDLNTWPNMPEAAKPRVVQTMDLGARPTAVKATLWGSNLRGWIATEEGNMRLYDLGGYGNGTGTGTLKQVGSVMTGPNPTSIAYFRGSTSDMDNDINNYAMVLSRGDKTVRWVDFSSDHNSAVVRPTKLSDTRLADPVMIEDNENHGTEAWVLSVADYAGKSVHNFRYGSVIFHTNRGSGKACQPPAGCGLGPNNQPASQYPFEYGGAIKLPGKPFFVTTANVP